MNIQTKKIKVRKDRVISKPVVPWFKRRGLDRPVIVFCALGFDGITYTIELDEADIMSINAVHVKFRSEFGYS